MNTRLMLLFVALATAIGAAGCSDASPPLGPVNVSPDLRPIESSSPPLVLHLVPPQATDPAIDRFLDNHYVWLDTAMKSNHKLLVFMP